MRNGIEITDVRFTPAGPEDWRKGLSGWISCTLNDRLQINSIALRRSRSGRMVLSFPAREDKAGNQRFYIKPLDDVTRRVIERQIFREMGIRKKSP